MHKSIASCFEITWAHGAVSNGFKQLLAWPATKNAPGSPKLVEFAEQHGRGPSSQGHPLHGNASDQACDSQTHRVVCWAINCVAQAHVGAEDVTAAEGHCDVSQPEQQALCCIPRLPNPPVRDGRV